MKSLDAVIQQFRSKCTLIDTSTAPRFSMHQEDRIWILEKGSVDIFALEESEKSQLEIAHFLVTEISAPAFIFSISDHESTRLATRASSCLYQIPFSVFWEWAEKEDNFPVLSEILSEWIIHLSKVFKDDTAAALTFLTPSEVLSLKADECFALKAAENPEERKRVQWIEVLDGEVSFVAFSEIRLSQHQIFPLDPHLVLKANTASRVRVVPEHDILISKKWKESIDFFHFCFTRFLKAFFKQREKEQKRRIAIKKEAEQEILGDALYQIGISLEPEIAFPILDKGDALIKACQVIGSNLGIEFFSGYKHSNDLVTSIGEICRSNNIRFRKVFLELGWWKKDCGPLLCFYGSELIPVALIFEKSGYFFVDPSQKIRKKLTPNIAEGLASFSFVFYSPLPKTTKGLKFILQSALRNHIDIRAVLFAGALGALFTLFPPFAAALLFSSVLPSGNTSLLSQLLIGLIIASLAGTAFFVVRALSVLRVEGKVSNFLQAGLMDRLLELPVQFFRKYTVGDLINRVLAIEQIRRLLSGNATQAIISGIFALFYLLVMWYFSMPLFFSTLLFFLIGLATTFLCLHLRSKKMHKIYELEASINSIVLQMIAGVGKLRVSASETNAFAHWAQLFASWIKIRLKLQSIQNAATVINAILPSLTTTVIFTFIIFFMGSPSAFASPKITLPVFLGFYIAFTLLFSAMFNIGSTLFTLSPILALWKRALVILETEPEEVKKGHAFEELSGRFALDRVFFRYSPNQSFISHKISLQGDAGEFIGIVGPSGCGKSTLINLLLGFYHPEIGGVYYNDKDLRTCDIREVRRQIGTVLQHDSLLSGTIYDNIVAGRIFTKQEIDKVLDISGFAEELSDFPMGLHTYLSVGGETLSGGQKQKLLIARALIGNPRILIFDEATSALDNMSQEWIATRIADLNITRIAIAHRLSTVRAADRIYVMDKGKVVDTGTFHELENKPGLFSEMLAKQKL